MISYQNAESYCYEDIAKIENYALALADESQVWHCHHRLEIIMNCGKRELIAKGAYFDRPAHELVFLTRIEHMRLHKTGNKYRCGRHHSDEVRRRIREAKVGIPLTMEHRRKISEKGKGRILPSETRRKMSESSLTKKPVEMNRKADGFTQTFPSQSEAARWLRENGYPRATTIRVSECANGHRKTAYNATWRHL